MASKARKKSRPRQPASSKGAARKPAPGWLASLGVMRVALLLLAAGVMAMSPKPGTPMNLDGTGVLTTLIAPSLAPIVFMVLMLDLLMGKVFMSTASGAERERYRRIVATNLAAGILLVLWWAPYFVKLMKP